MPAEAPFQIRSAWRADFAARDRRPIYDWARDHVTLHPPLKPGIFEVNDSRQFIAPFDALLDPHVREVNVCAPVGDGKTLIADVWLAWLVVNDPGSFLGVFQKDDVAKTHCETRTWKNFESIPAIKAKLDALDQHQARTQEILFDDPIYILGPSTRNLQHKRISYLWFDEAWQFPKGIMREAKGRLATAIKLGTDKTLVTSQGGQKQNSASDRCEDWWLQFDAGELNAWHVPCQCGTFHIPPLHSSSDGRADLPVRPGGAATPPYRGLTWTEHKDERGFWLISKCLETLRYVCPHCGHVTAPSEQARCKSNWNRGGKHLRIGEEKRIKKSYTNNGLINYPWEFIAEEFLTAKNHALRGDKSALVQFRQKYLAQFHDETEQDDDFTRLPTIEIEVGTRSTASPSAAAPPIIWTDETTGEQITFTHRHLMIDVSLRRLWAVASAWSDTGDDLTLEAREIPAEPSGRLKYEEVESMQKQWGVLDQDVGWDVNYDERAQEVIEEIVKHGHFEGKNWLQWVGYRGSSKENFPYHPKGKRLRLLPVVMEPKLIERIDPCPGILTPAKAPEFFATDPAGVTFKKFALVFKWSKPYFSSLIEARRDGRARGIRSVSLKGPWNEEFDRHMHGERLREVQSKQRGYFKSERYAAARHDFADCKKMDCAHAMRRGYLIPAETPAEDPVGRDSVEP